MLDHVTIGVSDLERSKEFYDKVLNSIGIQRLYEEGESAAGYGINNKAFFWIGFKSYPITGTHIAFGVHDRALVDRFHATGLSVGGRDNGLPGLRQHYHPHYYAAFILDPDGHNIEAVCHHPA